MSRAAETEETSAPDGSEVLEIGAIVVDRESDDDEAVVINTPPKKANEWVAYRDRGGEVTVADDNPGYDAEAPVVVVAFRRALRREDAHPDWTPPESVDLPARCSTYAFPPGRLRRVGTVEEEDARENATEHPADPSERLTEDQLRLRERLSESCAVRVVDDPDDPAAAALVVEKLGDEYVIRGGGGVEDGPLADRLREITAEFLGGDSE